jgi:hypothetical protein
MVESRSIGVPYLALGLPGQRLPGRVHLGDSTDGERPVYESAPLLADIGVFDGRLPRSSEWSAISSSKRRPHRPGRTQPCTVFKRVDLPN